MPYDHDKRGYRRSRSPSSIHVDNKKRPRSQSPEPQRHHRRHHHRSSHTHYEPKAATLKTLPFKASRISKRDYNSYKSMFELYLDIQKQKILDDLQEEEVRGRWKSFVGKWNRGELAEGWYDPTTLQKAAASSTAHDGDSSRRKTKRESPIYNETANEAEDSDEDEVGPTQYDRSLSSTKRGPKSGPAIPNMQDLEMQRAAREDIRYDRKLDRKQQKERLDELVPRAEAGSKDRLLEKKREKADNNRAFASAKTDVGGVEEVPESDLLGDDDGGIIGFKKRKTELERKKNERELRKEEILRTRVEEREERVRAYQEREERTMSGLVALAKARFG